ncbi:hypothetical protein Tco_0856156 [Tanacetum coccineum]
MNLRNKFPENYIQQKLPIRDTIVLHNINKGTEIHRRPSYKGISLKVGNVKGAPECFEISVFVHGNHNPELIKRFTRENSKTEDENEARLPRLFFKGKGGPQQEKEGKFLRPGTPGRGSWQNFQKRGEAIPQQHNTKKRPDSRQERYTENYSESEDSEGGHWKSKFRRKKSSVKDDDLSQPWVCAETDPFTSRIRHFDFPKTRMPSHVKTYNGSEDPEDHVKIFQAAAKTKRLPRLFFKGKRRPQIKKGRKFLRPGDTRKGVIGRISKKGEASVANIRRRKDQTGEVGHNTDECNILWKQIEDMLKAGKLSHIIRELKQNSGKEQPKKKGETSGKEKPLD